MVEPTSAIPFSSQVDLQSFYLIRLIGKGGFGKVLLVKKKDTNVTYALKVLKKKLLEKKSHYENIISERCVLVTTNHPFVIKLAHAFQNERKLFFVLEYCPGGEMRNLLQKQKVFTEES